MTIIIIIITIISMIIIIGPEVFVELQHGRGQVDLSILL